MSTSVSRSAEIAAQVWARPRGEIYALVDAAADGAIFPAVQAAQLEQCCLYDGGLPRVLAEAAPYLLRLQPWAQFTSWLLDAGWDKGWCVLLASAAPLAELRRHFRRMLLVRDESGRQLYFRFYDPRVLRAYLPTCNGAELRTVFGPVDRFWAEAESGQHLYELSFDGASLVRHAVALRGVSGLRGPRGSRFGQ